MNASSDSEDARPKQLKSELVVPDDFPQNPFTAALAGTQTKIVAR
jgi:hypothetical protein